MRDLLGWDRRGEFSLILSLQLKPVGASNEPQVPVPAQCGVSFPQVSLPSTPMTGEEDWEDYREGGYHPVNIGDEFANGRYVVVRKLGWSVSPIPFTLFGPFNFPPGATSPLSGSQRTLSKSTHPSTLLPLTQNSPGDPSM